MDTAPDWTANERALLDDYRRELLHGRRRSEHTVRAYLATAERLFAFLREYRGGAVTRAALSALEQADLRAYLAHRRGDALSNRSTARELSAIRSLLRVLKATNASLRALSDHCPT